jgi:hypothetical protein
MCLAMYELGVYIPEDGILHSHRYGNLRTLLPLVGKRTIPTERRPLVHEI